MFRWRLPARVTFVMSVHTVCPDVRNYASRCATGFIQAEEVVGVVEAMMTTKDYRA